MGKLVDKATLKSAKDPLCQPRTTYILTEGAYATYLKKPSAIAIRKDSIQLIAELEFEKALNYLRDQVIILSRTEDYDEGLTVFKEKRNPVWTGR